jgi:hypothetical protein
MGANRDAAAATPDPVPFEFSKIATTSVPFESFVAT